VQGRLRQQELNVTIDTVCGHCDQPLQIRLNHDLSFQVAEIGANPLVFLPEVDWQSFTQANILDAY
jgi:hypothetical protein